MSIHDRDADIHPISKFYTIISEMEERIHYAESGLRVLDRLIADYPSLYRDDISYLVSKLTEDIQIIKDNQRVLSTIETRYRAIGKAGGAK